MPSEFYKKSYTWDGKVLNGKSCFRWSLKWKLLSSLQLFPQLQKPSGFGYTLMRVKKEKGGTSDLSLSPSEAKPYFFPPLFNHLDNVHHCWILLFLLLCTKTNTWSLFLPSSFMPVGQLCMMLASGDNVILIAVWILLDSLSEQVWLLCSSFLPGNANLPVRTTARFSLQ